MKASYERLLAMVMQARRTRCVSETRKSKVALLEAIGAAKIALDQARQDWRELEQLVNMLDSPNAEIKEGFAFAPSGRPAVYFDGVGGAEFGYVGPDDEWTEEDQWPFTTEAVYVDDLQRLGIKVRS